MGNTRLDLLALALLALLICLDLPGTNDEADFLRPAEDLFREEIGAAVP